MSRHEYFATRTADSVERERLTAAETANDDKSRRHLLELGVGPGWSCLEVGAGCGSITRWLAERVGRDGRVVAIDVDTRFLQEINQPNVEIRRLDVLRDALEDSTYDLVHSRLLLMHLPDPQLVVRRMIQATRLGGWIMIEEADFASFRGADSSNPLSESFAEKFRAISDAAGRLKLFDPYFGRRVRALLEREGLSEVGSEGAVRLVHGGEAEAHAYRLTLPALVKADVCSENDSLELQKALSDPGFTFIGLTMFSAWGRRAV